jgi:hypothetical protein
LHIMRLVEMQRSWEWEGWHYWSGAATLIPTVTMTLRELS